MTRIMHTSAPRTPLYTPDFKRLPLDYFGLDWTLSC